MGSKFCKKTWNDLTKFGQRHFAKSVHTKHIGFIYYGLFSKTALTIIKPNKSNTYFMYKITIGSSTSVILPNVGKWSSLDQLVSFCMIYDQLPID